MGAYAALGVDSAWYAHQAEELKRATGATALTQKLGGWIAEQFPAGQFLADNRALMKVPLDLNLDAYLARWSVECPLKECCRRFSKAHHPNVKSSPDANACSLSSDN